MHDEDRTREPVCCDFCGKARSEVSHMFAGVVNTDKKRPSAERQALLEEYARRVEPQPVERAPGTAQPSASLQRSVEGLHRLRDEGLVEEVSPGHFVDLREMRVSGAHICDQCVTGLSRVLQNFERAEPE